MYIQQGAPAAIPLSLRLQVIFAALAHAVKIIGMDNSAARTDAIGSRLEPHLQYDIGEIDYDRRRTRSLGNPSSYESRLWLHHYPR
jgi:hypothetical protein